MEDLKLYRVPEELEMLLRILVGIVAGSQKWLDDWVLYKLLHYPTRSMEPLFITYL